MAVTGIGGIFFRSSDPQALAAWYRQHLGIGAGCTTDAAGPADEWAWMTAAGPLVFAPFPADSDYFPTENSFMLNLRVSDLDGLVVRLHAAGIATETRSEWDSPETGRFARLHDPEGNPLELWQPPA